MCFSVDGNLYFTYDITVMGNEAFHFEAYTLLSMAVGLTAIDPPDANTSWTANYFIDYIRLYQKPGLGTTTYNY